MTRRAVSIVAATGMLGTGFLEESLREAVARGAVAIGCDAGSSDPGPRFLGTGELSRAGAALKRDLDVMIRVGREAGIPVVVGSAINAGADRQLAEAVAMVKAIAAERGFSFKLAVISGEVPHDWLVAAHEQGRVRPMPGLPPLTRATIDGSVRFVAQMGPEPILRALAAGADVVLCGRASDAAVFAALGLHAGVPADLAWHAGKILECGAAPAIHRIHPDCIMATFDANSFTIAVPNPRMACSRLSVLAHGYYENADPYEIHEPGGMIDLSKAVFEEVPGGKVRVSGSRFVPAPHYEVRVEGSRLDGYRSIVVAGISDPILLDDLDGFLTGCEAEIRRKCAESLGLRAGDFQFKIRRYGAAAAAYDPGATDQVGVIFEMVAADQPTARAAVMIASHTALHHPVAGWQGFVSNLAIPFSPAAFDGGPVYRWSANHLVRIADPLAVFAAIGPHPVGEVQFHAAG
ncbi:MAG: acyclic terpene utilization AtuA family protein [Acetobacteraceae bacterium]